MKPQIPRGFYLSTDNIFTAEIKRDPALRTSSTPEMTEGHRDTERTYQCNLLGHAAFAQHVMVMFVVFTL